jgi:O-antigen ligase
VAVNAVLFLRPADFIPALLGLELYQYLILLCLAVSFPAVLGQLQPAALEKRPISLCVLALLPVVVLSHLAHVRPAQALLFGLAFAKVVVYYLLFVGLVTTPRRVRTLMAWVALFAVISAALTVLDWHKVITLPRPQFLKGVAVPPTDLDGAAPSKDIGRLVGVGLFQDPNDLCLFLIVGLILVLSRLADRRDGLRLLWLPALPLLGYAFVLTQSRGGLLALLAGLGLLIRLRYGLARAVLLGALGLPVLLTLLAGRQTDISVNATTGQSRIQLWSDGLMMFRSSPLFGVGVDEYAKEAGHVAHNSYLHCFSELGFFGGVCYLGAWCLAVWGLSQFARPAPRARPGGPRVEREILDPELRDLYPFLAGAVAAYAVGMLTLTLCYVVPTYTVLGLAVTFLAQADTRPATPQPRFDLQLVVRLAVLGLCFLACMQVFVRLFFRP